MHGTDEHVDIVALDQLVGIFGRFRGVGLVIDGVILDFTSPKLSSLFLHRELEAVGDRIAERSVGAAVRKHQAHLELSLLCVEGVGGER